MARPEPLSALLPSVVAVLVARHQPQETDMTDTTCENCGGTETCYQSFSAGKEYYCPDCDETFPYRVGQAPPRVQMITDGRFEELRAEMREHFAAESGEKTP